MLIPTWATEMRHKLLVSTYVVCERLSVMHEPAGVVENLVQNSTVYPYSAIQNTPPLKIVRNLGTLTFQLQNTPPMKIVRNLGTLTF